MNKADGSPVTNADFGSQALIVHLLRKSFPIDPIMAEESADESDFAGQSAFTDELLQDLKSAGAEFPSLAALAGAIDRTCGDPKAYEEPYWRRRYWVIDPIDGTKGFLKGGQYAIALALIEDGIITLGTLACPEYRVPGSDTVGAIFYASRGQGSFAVPLDGEAPPVRLRVGSRGPGTGLIMCESLNHSPHGLSGRVARALDVAEENVMKMDSQAKYAAVACGDADFYLRLPTSESYREAVWDHAAGAIVITEAGGKVTDMDGHDIAWTDDRSWSENHRFSRGRGVVVSNGKLHAAILEAVASIIDDTGKG